MLTGVVGVRLPGAISYHMWVIPRSIRLPSISRRGISAERLDWSRHGSIHLSGGISPLMGCFGWRMTISSRLKVDWFRERWLGETITLIIVSGGRLNGYIRLGTLFRQDPLKVRNEKLTCGSI